MKILLLGEYSNVHATLAKGLRAIGHHVLVVSNGDYWKDYPRDIDVSRRYNKFGGLLLLIKIYALLPKLKDFDVVQLINPLFFELKPERIFPIYRYLRKHNKVVIMGAMGMDSYWIKACREKIHLRYSDFNLGNKLRTDECAIREYRDWIGTTKEQLNSYIAHDCDKIVAVLYEYYTSYMFYFPQKTAFIPVPIQVEDAKIEDTKPQKINIFIGINKTRSVYKGTDIMLKAALAIKNDYPSRVNLLQAENVPFEQYQQMMNNCHIILDQLYSYTPAMNALAAMNKGIICVGGGEEEHYVLLKEDTLRPIINVVPNEKSVYEALKKLVLHPEKIVRLQKESAHYVAKHHDYIKIAKAYEALYISTIEEKNKAK